LNLKQIILLSTHWDAVVGGYLCIAEQQQHFKSISASNLWRQSDPWASNNRGSVVLPRVSHFRSQAGGRVGGGQARLVATVACLKALCLKQ
jgi:hypothetical protein